VTDQLPDLLATLGHGDPVVDERRRVDLESGGDEPDAEAEDRDGDRDERPRPQDVRARQPGADRRGDRQ
jgi:hypothetical protein